jgi:hypothetical protein
MAFVGYGVACLWSLSGAVDANRVIGKHGEALSGIRQCEDAAIDSVAVNLSGIHAFAIGCAIDRDRHGLQIGDVHAGVPIHIDNRLLHPDGKDAARGGRVGKFRDASIGGGTT